ncbi:MAG: protoheme IX farnesyltransferase [Chitinophagales bacterium]|nr:protoheme IX farnesyltransferase [Chitinophagales bacterium]
MQSTTKTYNQSFLATVSLFFKHMAALTKMRLSLLVVFSADIAYLFALDTFSWQKLILISIAGYLITGASNAINQIYEKESDKLMDRTKSRPLPSNQMSVITATIIAGVFGVGGISLLAIYFNIFSGLLGALALISYAFIYTPFKKISPIAVFIGAIPGAMPLLIGWTAATNSIGLGGVLLFTIQFFWQIPHFWAIAWVLDDDYKKAGFSLLPSAEGRTRGAALQNIPYLVGLIIVSCLPYYLGLTGAISCIVLVLIGMFYLWKGVQLATDLSLKSAKQLMFASFIYLPIAFIALLIDKI